MSDDKIELSPEQQEMADRHKAVEKSVRLAVPTGHKKVVIDGAEVAIPAADVLPTVVHRGHVYSRIAEIDGVCHYKNANAK